MKTLAKTIVRRGSIFLAVVVLLFLAVSAFVLGTETGTRWALREASQFVPGELLIDGSRGTFLSGLEIAHLEYRNDTLHIAADDVRLRASWLRSRLDSVYLSRLALGTFTYESLTPPDPEVKPLQISMPALPIWIGVAAVRVDSLSVGDFEVTGIDAADVWLRGNRISAGTLGGTTSGIVVEVRKLNTRLEGNVPVTADVSWHFEDGQWSGEGSVSGTVAELDFSHALAGAYPASASGKAFLLNRIDPEVDAVVTFERWVFGPVTLSNADVRVSGSLDDYQAGFDLAVSEGPSLSATVAGEASGDRNGLDALDLVADGPLGHLAAAGRLSWLPNFSMDVELRAQDFDPSRISGLATGQLDAVLRLQAEGVEHFSVQIDSLDGRYNGEPAHARGSISRDGDHWQCVGCEAAFGSNRLAIGGELQGERLAAKVDLIAPELHLIHQDLGGALTASVTIRGDIATPVVSGNASATGLRFTRWSAASLNVVSRSSTLDAVDLDVDIEGLQDGETNYGGGSATLNGRTRAIRSTLQWTYEELRLEADATVSVDGPDVIADVHSASLSEPFAGTWRLAEPLRFSMLSQAIAVTPHRWENGEAVLQVAEFSLADGDLRAEASLQGMPLETINVFLPDNLRLGGYADASLRLGRDAEGQRVGGFHWTQRDTIMRVTPPADEPIDIVLPVASAEVRLVGGGAEGEARIEIEPGVRGSLVASVDDLSTDAMLNARLLLDGEEWSWISALFPEIDNFEGLIATDIRAWGRVGAPELAGELRWQEGRLAVPALNLPIEKIDLTVAGSSAGSATIKGTAAAGAGTLAVDGLFENLTRADRSFTVRLQGSEATLLNWPEYQVVASPDIEITGDLSGVKANGKVSVDRAEITVKEIPEGAVVTSSDVTVVGREEDASGNIPFSGEVMMVLSEDVHINAFGLDSNVRGQLQFSLPENREPRAVGELHLVNGVFAAYGQRLTIDEGTLTFTGPLDDPIIFVRAIRVIEGVSGTIKAGIELRGRAQNLSSTVFSDPAMSEADALSYLVIGRALEDASAADGNMLSGAAYALGLRQASVVTSQIGQTLGLDQLAVSGSNQSTTALVAGKQLNPKLYVRYAYGVFTQIGNLLLRYKLTRRLTIEAGTGADTQSMDLLYSVEKP